MASPGAETSRLTLSGSVGGERGVMSTNIPFVARSTIGFQGNNRASCYTDLVIFTARQHSLLCRALY